VNLFTFRAHANCAPQFVGQHSAQHRKHSAQHRKQSTHILN